MCIILWFDGSHNLLLSVIMELSHSCWTEHIALLSWLSVTLFLFWVWWPLFWFIGVVLVYWPLEFCVHTGHGRRMFEGSVRWFWFRWRQINVIHRPNLLLLGFCLMCITFHLILALQMLILIFNTILVKY